MEKRNAIIREVLEKKNLPLWYLGTVLRRSESSITRMMREELPKEEQIRIAKLIEKETIQREGNEHGVS